MNGNQQQNPLAMSQNQMYALLAQQQRWMESGTTCGTIYTSPLSNAQQQGNPYNQPAVAAPKRKSMFKEIATDIRGFILEHRGVIYFIAFALLVDHFFFKGAFKTRLQGMADKVVTKVEEKIK